MLTTRASPLSDLCILLSLTSVDEPPSDTENVQNARKPFLDEVTKMLFRSEPLVRVIPLQAKQINACVNVLPLKSFSSSLKTEDFSLDWSEASEQPFHFSLFRFWCISSDRSAETFHEPSAASTSSNMTLSQESSVSVRSASLAWWAPPGTHCALSTSLSGGFPVSGCG